MALEKREVDSVLAAMEAKAAAPPRNGPDHPSERKRRINSTRDVCRGNATVISLADNIQIDRGFDDGEISVLVDDLQEHPIGEHFPQFRKRRGQIRTGCPDSIKARYFHKPSVIFKTLRLNSLDGAVDVSVKQMLGKMTGEFGAVANQITVNRVEVETMLNLHHGSLGFSAGGGVFFDLRHHYTFGLRERSGGEIETMFVELEVYHEVGRYG